MNAIYERRSIRKFQEKDVLQEDISKIIDAARLAPSAKNRQPWKYIVFGKEQKKELIMAMEAGLAREEKGITDFPEFGYGIPDAKNTLRVMKEAPVLIVVLNTNGKSPFLPVNPCERIVEICDSLSIGAAIENMILAAEELGLGTLWIANTCFAYQELTAYLNTEHQLIGVVAVGYPDEKPPQRPRKRMEEITEYRW